MQQKTQKERGGEKVWWGTGRGKLGTSKKWEVESK